MISNEDNLRLNVLLRQDVHAIRIDESKMVVHALTGRGEGKIVLNPTSRDEQYLREVRELLSTHYLNSPGGYPVYIHRWTRMSQSRSDDSLEKLLKLGEPEAIVAVANAPGVSAEIAQRAWWALPSEETARALLRQATVATDELGRELAMFLFEFLPFEAEPSRIVENVRLLLQPGLLDEEERLSLWNRAAHKSVYYPGFLMAQPDNLPLDSKPHPDFEQLSITLRTLVDAGNPVAEMFLRLHSAGGQGFMQGIRLVLKRPSSQDTVIALIDAIADYFHDLGLTSLRQRHIEDIQMLAGELCGSENLAGQEELGRMVRGLMSVEGIHQERISAMLGLAQLSEPVLDPLFGGTDALGSAMRRHIRPLSEPILAMLNTLTLP